MFFYERNIFLSRITVFFNVNSSQNQSFLATVSVNLYFRAERRSSRPRNCVCTKQKNVGVPSEVLPMSLHGISSNSFGVPWEFLDTKSIKLSSTEASPCFSPIATRITSFETATRSNESISKRKYDRATKIILARQIDHVFAEKN